MTTWLLILGLTVWMAWFVGSERQRLAPLRRRHDHRTLWMAAIPPGERRRFNALLLALCDAFVIPRRYRFRFRPSDDIHTLYRRNERGRFTDRREFVRLAQRLEKELAADARGLVAEQPCPIRALVRCLVSPGPHPQVAAHQSFRLQPSWDLA